MEHNRRLAVPRYIVRVTTDAHVYQDIEVEADTKDEAIDLVYEDETWDDGTWVYQDISDDIPELVAVKEIK